MRKRANLRWLIAIAIAAVAFPVGVALTSRYAQAASVALIVSLVASTIALGVIAVQPVLAAARKIQRHQFFGVIALVLVLVHIAALFLESPDDLLFALSPDGPLRARMALIATIALTLMATLGALRPRLRWHPTTWRILHAYLAVVVIILGFGHALLTDGALDGPLGDNLIIGLGLFGLAGAAAAQWARRTRRARPAKISDRT